MMRVRIYPGMALLMTAVVTAPGKVYRNRPRNRISQKMMKKPMMYHFKLRQRMNFSVFHGDVNQKNDVAGRLNMTQMRDADGVNEDAGNVHMHNEQNNMKSLNFCLTHSLQTEACK